MNQNICVAIKSEKNSFGIASDTRKIPPYRRLESPDTGEEKDTTMMKNLWAKLAGRKVEDGMVSAEYAVGTVATTSAAGVLIWIFQQDWFKELIASLFKTLFSSFI